ncbi:TetR family transcriptional regulator [Streptomyces spongiae]|uniref:TetR family transcriptional regulator n=2 Tax=Streptomyces spongiae TaxID=565072 RepID=A0A5N8XBG1_9ACTN|nr:TetR family transcriptional regulator [Streptomyces spongiae]
MRLAREHGFDKVTVDMISAEAGVSPRTFFNYFPSKEVAVVGRTPGALPPQLLDTFVAGGPAHPRTVLEELTRAIVDQMAADPPERQEVHDIFMLAHGTPSVFAALMTRFDGFRQSLAAAVAQRMGPDADEGIPDLIATVAMAAVRTGMERWSSDLTTDGSDSPVPYVERSVALLHLLLAPDHTSTRSAP